MEMSFGNQSQNFGGRLACSVGETTHATCVEQTCIAFSLMCINRQCVCYQPHYGHSSQQLEPFIRSVTRTRSLPQQLSLVQKLMQGFLDDSVNRLRQIAERHKNSLQQYIDRCFGQSTLRRKLLSRERPEQHEITGHAMYSLLQQSTQAPNIPTPYMVSSDRFEQDIIHMRESLNELMQRIEKLWCFGDFSRTDETLEVKDIASLSIIQSASFRNCKSSDWGKIGKELAWKNKLLELSVDHCQENRVLRSPIPAGDTICSSIRQSTSLRSLTINNCSVTEKGVADLCYILQLRQLRLANNPAITEQGFLQLVRQLKQLEVLELPLPGVSTLKLIPSVSPVGDRGAMHIANNLKNLTKLVIGNNQLGQRGAVAIANGLKKLTGLGIENNAIGERGAQVIAQGLNSLEVLNINNNNIGDRGALALGRLAKLKYLDIQDNGLSSTCKEKLRSLLHQTTISF